MARQGFVYLMTNKPHGILYAGMAFGLPRRVYGHREGLISGFTFRPALKILVYHDTSDIVTDAIQRVKNFNHWPRRWRVSPIEGFNPRWRDQYSNLV
jgi:putative endonuclease